MSILHKLVRVGQMNEMDYEVAGAKENDYHLAWMVAGSILLAGVLVLGLWWLAQRDEMGWTKMERAAQVGQEMSVEKEAWIK